MRQWTASSLEEVRRVQTFCQRGAHALLAPALARRGEMNPYLASWYVHIAFLLLAIYLFRRRSRNQRLIPGLRV